MLIKETYSKKPYKKKRRKPFFEALLKLKSDESNLSLFGALNAKNIKKIKASIRDNVKGKENKKPKEAKESCKRKAIVFNETLDDTFDRLLINSESGKPKQSGPDLHSPVLLKSQSTNVQKYTGKRRQVNIFHLTSTPISSPCLDFVNERSKINYEHTRVNRPLIYSLSQPSTSFLNLSVKLYPDKECDSFDKLKSHPEIISAASPDMFSSGADDSVRNSNQCLTRREYSNRQITNASFDLEPSVQIISDSSSSESSYKCFPLQGSSHLSSQENMFENCNLDVRKEERLNTSKENIYKLKMPAAIGFCEHTENIDIFDITYGQKNHSTDSSLEANDVSKIMIPISSTPSTSGMKTYSVNTVLSHNTSSGSDVSINKNNNFGTKNKKSKKRFSIKASKQINFKRKFNSGESRTDKSLMTATRQIKSADNIQATIELHEHKENNDSFDKICDWQIHATDSINLRKNNDKTKKCKSKKRCTVKASNQINCRTRFYSAVNVADQAVMNRTRKIKSVDIFRDPSRKKYNSSTESSIVLSSETSKSEVDLENNACYNCEEGIYSILQSDHDSDVFTYSNDNFNANKKLGTPQNESEIAKKFSPLSFMRVTHNATSKLPSRMLNVSLSSSESSFELKYKKNGKKKKKYSLHNKKKVSCTRGAHSEENRKEKIIDEASKRQIKSFSDNFSAAPTAESLSVWKKNKRMSIARRQSHLVKDKRILNNNETCNIFTSFASCSSKSTSIHNHVELSSRNSLDVLAEDETDNNYSRNSIKSSSNLRETGNNDWDTASISCSVLLCNTVNYDTREKSGNFNEFEANARDFVLQKCGQSHPLSFAEVFTNSYLESSKKIGEGVYGEVFLCDHVDGTSTILKIIPIEGDIIVNGENQKKYYEILTEVLIASELSDLRYDSVNNTDVFSEFIKCWCVVGRYPDKLIQLWNEFSEVNGTENDSPTILDENQLFLVLELRNGGKPLESYVFNSAEQSSSLLLQVAFGLAVAESAMEFEHRDLHWGNVLVKPTQSKTAVFVLNGSEFVIPTKGVQATIIDFTLSRMLHKGCCIYNDLSLDPALFTATGDYQFEIYRLMKDKIRSEWANFEPYTNVLWLHYLLDKCLKSVFYHRNNTKVHKKYINILKVWLNEVMESNSSTHFVTHQNYR